jgi:SRSO17 transposase
MDRRFEDRKQAMLAECVAGAELMSAPAHLKEFLRPFQNLLGPAAAEHSEEYAQGLLSNLERKNVESIAYQHDQDRRALQHFIGTAKWDHAPLLDELCRQVGAELGEPDATLVIDPSSFPKCGKKSVGVARQWCGRLGKVDNCQVGVFLGYVSRRDQALCDLRLYLPKEWTSKRSRCREAGVPYRTGHRTRHDLALEMIRERRATLPHAWIAADDEFGKVAPFRHNLHQLDERYLLAVPNNLTVRVLPSDELPAARGALKPPPFVSLKTLAEQLPTQAWTQVDVRDGEKGPLSVEVAILPTVQAKLQRRAMPYRETAVFIRYVDAHGTRHADWYLSNAPLNTSAAEFARVASAERRIEECFRRGKSEAGQADYEVRTWLGWHHHQTLSLIASWFLSHETRRGKKINTRTDLPSGPTDHRQALVAAMEPNPEVSNSRRHDTSLAA